MRGSKIAWNKTDKKEKKKTYRAAIRMIHKGPHGNLVDTVIATSAGYPLECALSDMCRIIDGNGIVDVRDYFFSY